MRKSGRCHWVIGLVGLLFVLPPRATADEVAVAVAANFMAPMQVIAAEFERATGHRAVLAAGATGKFYAQIRNGAPFEVFLSADDETPVKLVKEGLAEGASRFTYAVGRLALWSAELGRVDGPAPLHQVDARRLAIANPRTAPYGAAAQEVLNRLGVAERWAPRLVQGENIAQAHQFVVSGNAELGLIALSQVWIDGRPTAGSLWVVPAEMHTPIRQDAVLLGKGRGKPAAEALLRFLGSEKGRAIVRRFGYDSELLPSRR